MVRLIAIRRNGQPARGLKARDLRLRVNGQDRRIFAVSSTTAWPKTIGIIYDGSSEHQFSALPGRESGAIINLLESVWQKDDLGFVVSFGSRAVVDVAPTGNLREIEEALPKIVARGFHGNQYWYDALSSLPAEGQQPDREEIYLIVSDLDGLKPDRPAITALVDQRVRVFSFFTQEDLAIAGHNDYQDMDYLNRTQRTAETLAKMTGGDVFTVKGKKDLTRAERQLANELQATYAVSYEGAAQVRERKVEIICKLGDVRLLYARE